MRSNSSGEPPTRFKAISLLRWMGIYSTHGTGTEWERPSPPNTLT